MRSYEFRIFGAGGKLSFIFHSCHFTDKAAIRSAKKFAGTAPLEVWRDLEQLMPEKSVMPPHWQPPTEPADGELTCLYEFKLSARGKQPLLFAAAVANEDQATAHARTLLDRHPLMTEAEIWRGMKLVRQV